MRPIYAFIVQTVDGYYEGPNGEFDWPNVDDEFNEFAVAQLEATDMLLFGRKTYEGMASFWPTEAALTADPVVAKLMNEHPQGRVLHDARHRGLEQHAPRARERAWTR